MYAIRSYYDSIHLNLRLAPQELWNQENPRLSDSILVVSLAAIFFPFIVSQNRITSYNVCYTKLLRTDDEIEGCFIHRLQRLL